MGRRMRDDIIEPKEDLTMSTALAESAQQNGAVVAIAPSVSILTIMDRAIANNTPPETLERLFALHERMVAMQAKQEFAAAMSAFKDECPQIPRRTPNHFFKKVNRNGVEGPSMYASLEDMGATTKPFLTKHGLSTRWGDSEIKDGMVTIACICTHVGGHSESASSTMPLESKAGSSAQQKFASAETYAMRRSLARVLGLTDCDEDDDGNGAPPQNVKTITDDQAANIDAFLSELNIDRMRFLKWLGVDKIGDIAAADFKKAISALEEKRRAAK